MASDCEINLEKEFSPSMWSKRFSDRDEVLRHHVQHAEKVSSEVVSRLSHQLDIPYGDSESQKLDMFGTDLPIDSPILVFIHGGYWQDLSRQQSRYPASSLCDAGIRTVIVGYDLCPKVTLYDIVRQVERAARFVFDYGKRNKSKGIYFAGHSAGAHLIAMLLSNGKLFSPSVAGSELMQGAILISGVYDLTSIINTSVNKCLLLTPEDAKDLSPHFKKYFHLSEHRFRLYILAGENDSFTFQKQSRDFYDMLMECCRVHNIHFEIKSKMDHFDIMETITENDNYLKTILTEDVAKYLI